MNFVVHLAPPLYLWGHILLCVIYVVLKNVSCICCLSGIWYLNCPFMAVCAILHATHSSVFTFCCVFSSIHYICGNTLSFILYIVVEGCSVQMAFFWVVVPYSLVEVYQCFIGFITLVTEAARQQAHQKHC
jgi:hypothetical protein